MIKGARSVCPQPATTNWQDPSTTKNSSSSRAPKTGAQLRDDPGEREKCQPYIAAAEPSTKPTVSATGMSTSSGDELSLRHLQRETRRRCMITATSIPLMNCTNRDIDHLVSTATAEIPVFCTVVTQAPVVVQQRASQPCTPVGSRRSSRLQQETQATPYTTGTSFTLSEHCNCGNSTVFCSDNPKH